MSMAKEQPEKKEETVEEQVVRKEIWKDWGEIEPKFFTITHMLEQNGLIKIGTKFGSSQELKFKQVFLQTVIFWTLRYLMKLSCFQKLIRGKIAIRLLRNPRNQ